jgi:hypothetical protein
MDENESSSEELFFFSNKKREAVPLPSRPVPIIVLPQPAAKPEAAS